MSITTNNKYFLANFSELVDRYDPTMILYNRRTKTFKYPSYPLKSLLQCQPQYGANESGIERTAISQPRYIRITDINEYGLLNDSIGVTAAVVEEKYFLQNNDLLFARSGATVGKAYLHKSASVDYKCFFAGYMIRFVVDDKIILPDYLFAFTQLNTYKEWVLAIQRAAGQPNINAEEYKSLKIPLPDLETQKAIVKKINAAYDAKLMKEAEANRFLKGIDSYILKELGIILPKKTIGLNSRIFTSLFSEVAGVRFDPLYFKNKGIIESKIFTNNTLRQIAKINKGQSITKEKITEGNYPVIAGGQSSPYTHSEFNFEGNIITVSASGAYSGFVWYHDYPIFASDCIVLQSKNEKEISTHFIYHVMKALQGEIYKLQQGAGQPHVYARDLEKVIIPTPLPAKQNEMLKHINDIHKQIIKLQNDAISILEAAKQEVERMILG